MLVSVQLYFAMLGVFILLLWAVYLPFRGGQLYNGPFYCMAIGAYAAAYTTKFLGYPHGVAILLALLLGTFIGFLTSLAFSRTTGIVTATASMALIFIVVSIINNFNLVGATRGIWGIPKFHALLPTLYAVVIVMGVIIYRIENSRFGRALEAMRTDMDLANSLGVNMPRLSTFVMTLASAMGTLAGVFYAFTLQSILPQNFSFTLVLTVLAMLFIGGRYTMWGVLVSAPILWAIHILLPPSIVKFTNLFYGALLVIILVTRPEGIVSREMLQKIAAWIKSWSRKAKPVAASSQDQKDINLS
jgi:branched-chain amino acid transport system permease protein